MFFPLQHGDHLLLSGLAGLVFFSAGDPLHKFFFVSVRERIEEFPDLVVLEKSSENLVNG